MKDGTKDNIKIGVAALLVLGLVAGVVLWEIGKLVAIWKYIFS